MKNNQIDTPNISKALSIAVTFFQKHKIPYVLCGAIVLSFYGRPRATLDLDFLVLANSEQFEQIKKLASEAHFKVDNNWALYNPMLAKIQLRLILQSASIDIMLPRDEHDRILFKRKVKKRIGNKMINIIAPEDYVIQKIKAGRPRDFEDTAIVLQRMRKQLKIDYIQRWIRRLGKEEEWFYLKKILVLN